MLKIIFMGNDKRSIKAREIMKEKFKNSNTVLLENLTQLKETYDVYILPIPLSLDGKILNNSNLNINVGEILDIIPDNALILSAGKTVKDSINIADRDDFSYNNAIPTAEGAIAIAINSTDISLYDSKVLITGFGRVSKILSQKLKELCKNITISVRKKSDMALIDALGFNVIPIEKIAENITDFDIVFNTIPYKIFNKEILSKANKDSLFVELASDELGFDTNAIIDLKIKYINAPGLPSKVAATSAAKILAETIINILEEKNLI